jgi:hypothetical protein
MYSLVIHSYSTCIINNCLLQIDHNKKYFCFTEWASKCNPGGIRNVAKKPKKVKVFATPGRCPGRCPVDLLDKYLGMT